MFFRGVISYVILILLGVAASAQVPHHFAPPYVCNRNYYVATNGTNNGACSQATPCDSIQTASNNLPLTGGDCVNVAAGTYNTNYEIDLHKGGVANRADGYVTYIGAPNHASIINYQGGGYYGLRFYANYLILDGFDFNGNGAPQDHLLVNSDGSACASFCGSHLIVMNNIIHEGRGAGFQSIGGDYFIFAGNIIHDNMWAQGDGSSGISIFHPTSTDTNNSLPWDSQYYHVQILNNLFYSNGCIRNDGRCTWHNDGNGFIPDDWEHNQDGQPAYTGHGLIFGNIAWGNGGRGFSLAPSTLNLDVFNNTSSGDGLDSGGACEMNLSGQNIAVGNNILIGTVRVPFCTPYPNDGGRPNTGVSFTHNITFTGTPGQQGISLNSPALTLSQIQAANALLGVDPKVTNYGGHDFHLQAGSPAINAGGALPNHGAVYPFTSLTDIVGTPYGSTPDIGAVSSGTAPTPGLTFTANPTTINLGGSSTLTWSSTAASCTGTGFSTGGAANGSVSVSPTTTTVYSINCAGTIANATVSVTVPNSVQGPVSIAVGSPNAAAPFIADAGFNGGATAGPSGTVDESRLTGTVPPNLAIQFQRYGTEFNYVISGLDHTASYIVNLYFVEGGAVTAAGVRQVNVSINGSSVISGLDIFAQAGGTHNAIQRTFTVQPDTNGNLTIDFTGNPAMADPKATVNGIQVLSTTQPPPVTNGVVSIDAGGPASGNYLADVGFTGGRPTAPIITNAIDVTGIPNPAAQVVYQSDRVGIFSYAINCLTPGATYSTTLTFSENYWTGPGQRIFNVSINGNQVLTNFDIFATAGANFKAIQRTFSATADANGIINIAFTPTAASPDQNAQVDAIDVSAASAVVLQPLTLATNTFVSGTPTGTVITNIQGTTTGSTLTISGLSTANAVQVAFVGGIWQLQVGAGAIAGAQTYTFNLVETLNGATGSPKVTALSVSQTLPALQPLTLSANTFASGMPQGTIIGTIQGTSSGSTVAINTQSTANAIQVVQVGTSNVWQLQVGSGATLGAQVYTFNLVETLAGAGGSPRTTNGLSVTETAQTLQTLTLTGNSFNSGAAQGTVIGTIGGTTSGSSVQATSQSTSNAFQVAFVGGVWQLQVGSSALTGNNSYTLCLQETLAGATGSPKTTCGFTVSEVGGITLGPLTISNNTFVSGSSLGTVIANVIGNTPGSTVTITSLSTANAIQIVNVGGQWQLQVGSGVLTGANTYTFSLVETLSGATGSPRTTSGFSITETAIALQPLSLSGTTFTSGSGIGTLIGNIIGTSPGSTVTIGTQSTASALQVAQVSGIWQLQVGSGALTGANTYTLSLVETLSGATGSPKTTAGLAVNETAIIPPGNVKSEPQFQMDSSVPALVQVRDRSGTWVDMMMVDPISHSVAFESGIEGDVTAGIPNAGNVGESLSNVALAQAITTSTPTNIAQRVIPAGHWSCYGYLTTNPAGTTTISKAQATVTTASATDGAGMATNRLAFNAASTTGIGMTLPVGPTRFDFVSPTSLYLVGDVAYAVSTLTADAGVFCDRVW
jgi:hypothetical protein